MEKRRCFIISPIGAEDSPVRKHADDVLDLFIRPAMETCKVQAFRADELREPGRITEQMYREILNADFCIALLTGQNPNVFFELAVAMSAGKPVIVLLEKNSQLPFDVKDLRCLYYDFEPRALHKKEIERALIDYVTNIEEAGWRAEPLLQRFGKELPSKRLPDSYGFEQIASEINLTLAKLTDNENALLREYQQDGDAERLFDGLYSSILYLSRAAVTGIVEAQFYGNLMELDAAKRQFRVRYFAGPYNDEIITRAFPLSRRGEGIATITFNTQKLQVANSMAAQLKVKGEARLNAMACIPVPGIDQTAESRQIVLLNIDSGVPEAFPPTENLPGSQTMQRFELLAGLLAQINKLYRRVVEGAVR